MGLYSILERIGAVAYRLDLSAKLSDFHCVSFEKARESARAHFAAAANRPWQGFVCIVSASKDIGSSSGSEAGYDDHVGQSSYGER